MESITKSYLEELHSLKKDEKEASFSDDAKRRLFSAFDGEKKPVLTILSDLYTRSYIANELTPIAVHTQSFGAYSAYQLSVQNLYTKNEDELGTSIKIKSVNSRHYGIIHFKHIGFTLDSKGEKSTDFSDTDYIVYSNSLTKEEIDEFLQTFLSNLVRNFATTMESIHTNYLKSHQDDDDDFYDGNYFDNDRDYYDDEDEYNEEREYWDDDDYDDDYDEDDSL